MAKQTFTTGQVLTAAQMTSLQQTAMGGGSASVKTTSYVLVAADAGTVIQMNAAVATTITVNTSLFSAGDSVQIQNIGAGTCTITAGTATVNSAGSLAVTQYDGGFLYFSSASSAIWFDYTQPGTTSPLTTKGDLYTRTSTADARLAVGANGTTLVADSSTSTGLKWDTAASGGMTLINTGGTTLTGASITISSIPTTYIDLRLIVENYRPATNTAPLMIRYNGDSGTNYRNGSYTDSWAVGGSSGWASTLNQVSPDTNNGASNASINIYMPNYAASSNWKANYCVSIVNDTTTITDFRALYFANTYKASAAITSLQIFPVSGNFTSGTAYLYGVK